jgi:hypothetical protein
MHLELMLLYLENIKGKLESTTVYQLWTKVYLKSMKSLASHELAHMSIAFDIQ